MKDNINKNNRQKTIKLQLLVNISTKLRRKKIMKNHKVKTINGLSLLYCCRSLLRVRFPGIGVEVTKNKNNKSTLGEKSP